MSWINTIISEMGKGNFSFLILVVGILALAVGTGQLIVMILNRRKPK